MRCTAKPIILSAVVLALCIGVPMVVAVEYAFSIPAPIAISDAGYAHITVGPEVIWYLKVFCWAIGAMFAILTLVASGLGWFFKRTLDKIDASTSRLTTMHAKLEARQDALQSEVDSIMAEHKVRGNLCPGLRPDILKQSISCVLGTPNSYGARKDDPPKMSIEESELGVKL